MVTLGLVIKPRTRLQLNRGQMGRVRREITLLDVDRVLNVLSSEQPAPFRYQSLSLIFYNKPLDILSLAAYLCADSAK